jgi:hypothetical protein
VFHVPGTNRASGSDRGGEGIMQIVATIGEATGGQFEELVHDVLANACMASSWRPIA